jgi:hypothetical protein
MRGRVMSVYSLVFGGLTPIGSLYAGQLIEATSASTCMLVSGGIGLAATVTVAVLVRRRRQSAAKARGEAEPALLESEALSEALEEEEKP